MAGFFWVIFSTLLAAVSNTFWSMSQSATSSTLGWPVISLIWSLPRPRRPMVAMRMVSFGLPKTVLDAAAAAAVVRKKFRRSIGFVTAIRWLLYHITGISARPARNVADHFIHEARARFASGPGDVRRHQAIARREQRIGGCRRLHAQHVQPGSGQAPGVQRVGE